ncbi:MULTISPECIES: FAD-dependent monooxygenase [unclassified Agarivorans]|uniref:FAD-dependent monooxygenase n=1 Tax=unclassified Agarivorans TaxID=2636026 RepID=UPI003D7DEDD3
MQAVDIAIIGGGMVGLALARALADSPLRIAIVEPSPAQSPDLANYSLRVSALSLSSQRLLESLGAWDEIVAQRLAPYHDMQVWERDSFAKIRFQAKQVMLPQIGHIVENEVIRYALWQQVCSQSNVAIIESSVEKLHRGETESWLSFDNDQSLSCKLLVAADGANSWLRQQLDIPLTYWDYQHTAIVATIKTEMPHQNCARQIFSQEGPLAFLPLAEADHCSIVWSVSPDRAAELQALPELEFNRQLSIAFDARLGLCERVGEIAAFPLRMRYARDFAGQGFALIGDAAHTIHPLAGQGVNLGLMDAAALAEDILALQATGKSLSDYANLRHFERWRKSEATQMIASMEFFKRLFGNNLAPLKLVRGLGMNLLDKAEPLKQQAMRRALGLEGDLPRRAKVRSY